MTGKPKDEKMDKVAFEIGCQENQLTNLRDIGGFRFFADDVGRAWSVKLGKSGRVLKGSLRRDFV